MPFRKSNPTEALAASLEGAEAMTALEPVLIAGDAKETESAPVQTSATEDIVYPSGPRLGLLLTSVFISMSLVTLDRLIIPTAIPQVTDDFNSVTDIGWYGSAYFLTRCASQLLFGKLYSVYSIKATFLTTLFVLGVSSAVCGAAPNAVAFIVGRAIAGVGGAGIYGGVVSLAAGKICDSGLPSLFWGFAVFLTKKHSFCNLHLLCVPQSKPAFLSQFCNSFWGISSPLARSIALPPAHPTISAIGHSSYNRRSFAPAASVTGEI
ncbi:major facilitator superfamily domain-containing protein [Phialemonium atrogriseum]|uniref:Major facilitator superfamily domain-containing protein n=1 Tax=Phialemonium atrogriseum TaxID=1093897 RepID=A0AAJ0C5W0_9PEZI|nr:major facilitator superfamily domain-containing protein [Phialemonium atrogriseum]KAK1770739.1 major facilitator superfamily domain-containing protein [Phialemonium atrogriseum]